jgi:Uma2 family endonuclease
MPFSDIAVIPQTELPETDGEPLESPWHLAAIVLLMDLVRSHLRGRDDFFVGGNMFLYYSDEQVRNRDYKGPDFFFVDGVDGKRPRGSWVVWLEDGRYPDLIMELLSKTTAKHDRTTKKKLYERTFHTPEYFCYDPNRHKLEGWRLNGQGRYQTIKPNKHGWLWSEQLELWLGTWEGQYLEQEGTWPRLYRKDGSLVPTRAEAGEQRADRAEAELARLKARLGQPPID